MDAFSSDGLAIALAMFIREVVSVTFLGQPWNSTVPLILLLINS